MEKATEVIDGVFVTQSDSTIPVEIVSAESTPAQQICTISHAVYNHKGERTSMSHRSSMDPEHDLHLMQSFLEYEQATRLRNVFIPPRNLGTMLVVSRPSIHQHRQGTREELMEMLQWCIDQALASDITVTITTVSDPANPRMGEYLMVPDARLNKHRYKPVETHSEKKEDILSGPGAGAYAMAGGNGYGGGL